jgi:DUF4097 and DUF4098 domain-containing protein YvlB
MPRLQIEVVISLPRSIGDLDIKTISLPIFVQGVDKANDVVLKTTSSHISVHDIDARSLTVSSLSGSIAFESSSEQLAEKFIKVTNSSGSIAMRSSLSSPSVSIDGKSGSMSLATTMTQATEHDIRNTSGSVSGEINYAKHATSVATYGNVSGSLNITLSGWSGFLTAYSLSGSRNIKGSDLERYNDGWRNGDGESTATFKTVSGSINVKVL